MLFCPTTYGCPQKPLATIGWKNWTWEGIRTTTTLRKSNRASLRCAKFLTFSCCAWSGSHIMGRWSRNHMLCTCFIRFSCTRKLYSMSVQPHNSLGIRVLEFFWCKTETFGWRWIIVTGWCRGFPPSSCLRSDQRCWWCSERKDASGPQREWDASSAHTPAWPRSDRTADDALQLQIEDISVRERMKINIWLPTFTNIQKCIYIHYSWLYSLWRQTLIYMSELWKRKKTHIYI